MAKAGIYQLRNLVNGKVYIGSSIDLKRRKVDHFKMLRGNKHYNPKLQNAYNKYGEENIVFEIIEYVSSENLLKREQYYIDTLNVVNEGYNIAPIAGNRLNCKCSEETKEKLRNKRLGTHHTEEAKNLMREYRKQNTTIGEKNGMYGKKHTEETRNKMRLAQKGRNLGKHHTEESKRLISDKCQTKKKVRCIEEGITFNSVTDAAKYFNSKYTSHISECCKGKIKTYLGYHWEYVN